jgi:hypothetical protein
MVFSAKNQWLFGFWGFFSLEGIASDATWMYYVKTKKTKKPKKTIGLKQWFFHAGPVSNILISYKTQCDTGYEWHMHVPS